MRPVTIIAFALLTACGGGDDDAGGGGGDTLLTATFDGDDQDLTLEQPCAITVRDDGFAFNAIETGRLGIETVWESAAVDGPGSYESALLGGLVVFAMYEDPEDPSMATFADAEGTLVFDTYDPPARVTGSFDVTVEPLYAITGTFDCAE